MKRGNRGSKELVLEILTQSFDANQSVNYVIKQDKRRKERIRALMDYSFERCNLFGDVFISDDKKACALLVYPKKKRTSLKSVWLDIKLIINCIGLGNLLKTIKREKLINSIRPERNIIYLWFIGVYPVAQKNGSGSKLLQAVIDHSNRTNRPIYLATSNQNNLPWYKKHGFEIYSQKDIGYTLYFLRRKLSEK